MAVTSVSQCKKCRAVVNIHWPSCLVCQAAIPPTTPSDDLKGQPPSSKPTADQAGTYCQVCGSGYWIRPTHTDPLQCGRCHPTDSRVETVCLPGGSPIPPIKNGWLVTYRGRDGRLAGGHEDRARGTVQACLWNGTSWTVCLTDGRRLPLLAVLAVAKTNSKGRICGSWSVREHGCDGNNGKDT